MAWREAGGGGLNVKGGADELLGEKSRLELRLEAVKQGLRVLRELCEHDFVENGHDSHHRFMKCKVCGKEETS